MVEELPGSILFSESLYLSQKPQKRSLEAVNHSGFPIIDKLAPHFSLVTHGHEIGHLFSSVSWCNTNLIIVIFSGILRSFILVNPNLRISQHPPPPKSKDQNKKNRKK
uniref:Uncharacterized protein n=1 Tax=Opuntia streptacantha TaxID=393608 RepID=A0A7C9CYP8_OPUST